MGYIFMSTSHAFGNLPYGRLPREILEIAIDHNFKKHAMKLYAWIVVNSNQWNGQLLRKPNMFALAETLRMSDRQLWYVVDQFRELDLFHREKGTLGMQGNSFPIQKCRKSVIDHEARKMRGEVDESEEKHPLGNLLYGRLPRAYVEIAVESDLGKNAQRLYWWITLNTSEAGSMTRLADVVALAETLKMAKSTFFKAQSDLHETGLFSVERETVFKGTARHIKLAIDEAAELAFEKKRETALKRYLDKEEKDCMANLGRRLHKEERKAMTAYFLEAYAEEAELV